MHNGDQSSLPTSLLCLGPGLQLDPSTMYDENLGYPIVLQMQMCKCACRAAAQRLCSIPGQRQPNKARSLTLPCTSMVQGGTSKPYT